MKRICTLAALGVGLLGFANAAKAVNVDFEGFQVGSDIDVAGFGSGIFSVSATNSNGDDAGPATIIDTEATSNPNLKWKYIGGGNLPNARLRKVLIVPTSGGSSVDSGGGQISLSFFAPIKLFGFDVIDVDPGEAASTTVTFFDAGQPLATIPFSEFKNPASVYKRSGIVWGNDSANRIAPITTAQLSLDLGTEVSGFDQVVFDFTSEMAFDNLNYRVLANNVPEPATAGLLLGLPVLAALRRRRR